MRAEKLSRKDGFKPAPGVLESFHGAPRFYRIQGPAVFCRLVQFEKTSREGEPLKASRSDGQFWFHESLMNDLRVAARADLRASRTSSQSPRSSLLALYLRFCLRGVLAVSKNWTPDFDAYVTLNLGRGDSIIALVGKVKDQPYYSQNHPDHDQAAAAGIALEGKAWQYVIDFNFPANQPMRSRITTPHRLEGW